MFDTATGGLSWFTNLAAADPYFVLPVVTGLSTLFMTELGADGMNGNGQVGMKYMMRGMSLFMVFIAAKLPAVGIARRVPGRDSASTGR